MPTRWWRPPWSLSRRTITGTAANLFTVAGPVLVYGISASVLYGLILWLIQVL
ncbi:MAG: hypothetical protein ACLRWL_04130 [Evtepia gabavorous]